MVNQPNIVQFPAPAPVRTARMSADVLETEAANHVGAVSQHSREARPVAPRSADISLADVKEALGDNRLVVHYQPQFDVETGRTVAAEALIRLTDPLGNLVMPDRFIQAAEQDRLIVWLGRAVIRQACADLADMRKRRIKLARVAVNVAANQLEQDVWLTDFVQTELARHGLVHQDLELELTERQQLSIAGGGLERLNTLASRGCRIVLDDMGVGHASPEILSQLPFSALKLDRSMLQDLERDPLNLKTMKSILELAANLGLDVVAEGVETARQQLLLRQLGCRWAQGFGFARPMTSATLMGFLVANANVLS